MARSSAKNAATTTANATKAKPQTPTNAAHATE